MSATSRLTQFVVLASLCLAGCSLQRTVLYDYSPATAHEGALFIVRSETTYLDSNPVDRRSTLLRCEDNTLTDEWTCEEAISFAGVTSDRVYRIASPNLEPGAAIPAPTDVQAQELERQCWQDDASACFAFGLKLETGEGVPLDLERACRMYSNACSGGVAEACSRADACAGVN